MFAVYRDLQLDRGVVVLHCSLLLPEACRLTWYMFLSKVAARRFRRCAVYLLSCRTRFVNKANTIRLRIGLPRQCLVHTP